MLENNSIPTDWLVCPIDQSELKREGDTLISRNSKYNFHREGKFWDMTPYFLQELKLPVWKTWDHLQENGIVSYKEDPTKNLGVGPRPDHLQFKDFVGLEGRVLDIGVGPQAAPSHVENASSRELEGFVGLDPLSGDLPKRYKFVKGLGEYLPFRDDFFDKTMFVTSLDHFVDPTRALAVARRVTKKSGEVCVWMGEKSPYAPKPKTSASWYESLTVPDGAEDRFHLKRFGVPEFMAMAKESGLKVSDHQKRQVDEWRTNHFLKLKK